MRWSFQEWGMAWTLWAIGWEYITHGGWADDELTVAIGPLRLCFLRGAEQ